jgi:hypothetical protein
MTPDQIKMARHALGLPNGSKRSYRNRYCAALGSKAEKAWNDLVRRSHAERGVEQVNTAIFHLTESGARIAIDPTERLDPEDFPVAVSSPREPDNA